MTVDNLTFNQLDAIFNELAKRQERKKDGDIDVKLGSMPSVKGTQEEIDAWTKTGMKGKFQDFVKRFRKK